MSHARTRAAQGPPGWLWCSWGRGAREWTPLGAGVLGLLWMGPHSPDPDASSYTSGKSSNPNNGGPLCQKSSEKSPAPQVSWCWGSHRQPPSSGVIPPMDESTLSIAIMAGLWISQKGPGYVEKVPKQEPWDLFLLAHSTGSRYPLSLGRWLLKQP